MLKRAILALSVVLIASGFAIVPASAATIENVSTKDVDPGGEVTISIKASTVSGVGIQGVPNGWTVAGSSDDNGIFVKDDGNGDGHNENLGWAWPNQKSMTTVSATLNVPENAQPGDYEMEITARNGGEKTSSITVTVTGETDQQDGTQDDQQMQNDTQDDQMQNQTDTQDNQQDGTQDDQQMQNDTQDDQMQNQTDTQDNQQQETQQPGFTIVTGIVALTLIFLVFKRYLKIN